MNNLIIAKIDLYQKMINRLENKKPFWFQRRKLAVYHKKINKLEDEIIKLYIKLEIEIDYNMQINDY